jgi:antitoxin component of MazEF toxin-antitoxin module
MAIQTKIKRWGNSFGVILPKSLIEKQNLKEEDTITIEIVREADISDVFGMIKKRKMSGQEAKDFARRGWKI